MFKFHRGEYLIDLVSGFSGVVTGRSDYLTGCNMYFLKPRVDADGKVRDGIWFDEPALQYDPAHLNEKLDLGLAKEQPPG